MRRRPCVLLQARRSAPRFTEIEDGEIPEVAAGGAVDEQRGTSRGGGKRKGKGEVREGEEEEGDEDVASMEEGTDAEEGGAAGRRRDAMAVGPTGKKRSAVDGAVVAGGAEATSGREVATRDGGGRGEELEDGEEDEERGWAGVSTLKINNHKVGPGQPVLLVEQYCQPICCTRRVFISVLHVSARIVRLSSGCVLRVLVVQGDVAAAVAAPSIPIVTAPSRTPEHCFQLAAVRVYTCPTPPSHLSPLSLSPPRCSLALLPLSPVT